MSGWNFEHSYAKLPHIFYRKQIPEPAPHPAMVIFNEGLAKDLGLNPDELKEDAALFTGTALPARANPISQAYGGYQFGHFSMLGDGRAVLLGEQVTDAGRFDVQLKGSGPTPFSRGGDGYAALLPMLREYIISEAMHALGIPTTRSLAVALTGRDVYRQTVLQGAVLTRVAASHIRVGTFNFIARYGSVDDLAALADYSIWRHFPHLEGQQDKYLLFLREVCKLQAALIAKWQLSGFIHGVMNTDNMAISGETIDYGPCAFMDAYDPGTVFSSIDTAGRYAYKNQPTIGAWNLCRFAESLLPLLDKNHETAADLANEEIALYWKHHQQNLSSGLRAKLGLVDEGPDDTRMITELFDQMQATRLDYTNTFRSLALGHQIAGLEGWQEQWLARLNSQPGGAVNAFVAMKAHNPAVIPRNHRVEEALDAAGQGNFDVMHNLLAALSKPFEDFEEYSQAPAAACGYKTFCGT